MKHLLLIVISTLTYSCLDNDMSILVPSINFGPSELMLSEFEENGDFINSYENPALIEANEVYNNIDTYLLVDIRTAEEFKSGRIKKSVNITPDSLINYFANINHFQFNKIVIVSSTGQHAAFATSILRLLNYDNVYSLNFGMSIWNNDFADAWLNALNTDLLWFNHDNYQKPEFTPLPSLPNIETNNLILFRAKELMEMKFDELCLAHEESELTVDFMAIDNNYYSIIEDARGNPIKDLVDSVSFICYSNISLYSINIEGITFISNAYHSHPRETVLYLSTDENESDIRSSKFLQTLPSNKKIFIYSYSGQRSAYLTAYLCMLGYKAKTMVFGACSILYDSMIINKKVEPYAFKSSLINNFDYETQ